MRAFDARQSRLKRLSRIFFLLLRLCVARPASLGGQRGHRGGRARDARGVGSYAAGELNDIDEARSSDGAIVDGALSLHGAILVVAEYG